MKKDIKCTIEHSVRANVLSLLPFTPPPPHTASCEIVKLDANESLLGASPMVATRVNATQGDFTRYPDPTGSAFKHCLSQRLGLAPQQITLGNGSNDVLDMIARVFTGSGDEAIYAQYAFAVYPIITLGAGAEPVMVPAKAWGHDLEAMRKAIGPRTKVVYLANPNNPTGTWFDQRILTDFLDAVPPEVVVVLDEAYFEYCRDDSEIPDGVDLLAGYPNLIVTRTFSKAYGLAALRIGYALSHPEIADLLNRIRQPFNVNGIALGAAEAALSDAAHLDRTVELTRQGMRRLIDGVRHLGLSYIPSHGNYLCVDVGNAMDVTRSLAQRQIIVCPLANYGMPAFIRVTIGLATQIDALLIALREILGEVDAAASASVRR